MKPLSIDNIPLDDIEEAFEGENTETEGCSSLMTPALPKKQSRKWLLFFYLLMGKEKSKVVEKEAYGNGTSDYRKNQIQ